MGVDNDPESQKDYHAYVIISSILNKKYLKTIFINIIRSSKNFNLQGILSWVTLAGIYNFIYYRF